MDGVEWSFRRKGEEVPLLPKKVRVTELLLSPPSGGSIQFSISCSSGTYIRSIAHNIGESLGCGAHLESLRRTRIGDFRVEEAIALELFEALPDAERLSPRCSGDSAHSAAAVAVVVYGSTTLGRTYVFLSASRYSL